MSLQACLFVVFADRELGACYKTRGKSSILFTNDIDLPSGNFVFQFRVLYPKSNDRPPRGMCQVYITV